MRFLRGFLLVAAAIFCLTTIAANHVQEATEDAADLDEKTMPQSDQEISWVDLLQGNYCGRFKESYLGREFLGYLAIGKNDKGFFYVLIFDLTSANAKAGKAVIFDLSEERVFRLRNLSVDKADKILAHKTIQQGMWFDYECRGFQLDNGNYLPLDEMSGDNPVVLQFKSHKKNLLRFRVQQVRSDDMSSCYETVGDLTKMEKKIDWEF